MSFITGKPIIRRIILSFNKLPSLFIYIWGVYLIILKSKTMEDFFVDKKERGLYNHSNHIGIINILKKEDLDENYRFIPNV